MSSTLSADEKFNSKWAWLGSRDPFFKKILGPLYIVGMVKDRNFVFGTDIEHNKYYPSQDKLRPKVSEVRVTLPKFKTWSPFITFERMKVRAPNFVHLYNMSSSLSVDEKFNPKWAWFGSRDSFLCWTLLNLRND